MAILLSSLRRAREQAKASVCQSNLHQWSLVFSMYDNDYEGRLPRSPTTKAVQFRMGPIADRTMFCSAMVSTVGSTMQGSLMKHSPARSRTSGENSTSRAREIYRSSLIAFMPRVVLSKTTSPRRSMGRWLPST